MERKSMAEEASALTEESAVVAIRRTSLQEEEEEEEEREEEGIVVKMRETDLHNNPLILLSFSLPLLFIVFTFLFSTFSKTITYNVECLDEVRIL